MKNQKDLQFFCKYKNYFIDKQKNIFYNFGSMPEN